MRMIVTVMMAGMLGAGSGLAATRSPSGETAGATSLLTAERRAREAAERLQVPAAKPARWKAGGEGWTPAWTVKPRRQD